MNTNYQMWITGNAEAEKLRIPVLPEKFTVSIGSNNSSVDVVGLGEIVVKQSRPAYQFKFSSFFPARGFPGLSVSSLSPPLSCVKKIESWIDGKKPVHLILTGVGVDTYCTIESFSRYEQGGDVGTIYYDISLKEYREVTVRKVKVEQKQATVEKAETRVDNSTLAIHVAHGGAVSPFIRGEPHTQPRTASAALQVGYGGNTTTGISFEPHTEPRTALAPLRVGRGGGVVSETSVEPHTEPREALSPLHVGHSGTLSPTSTGEPPDVKRASTGLKTGGRGVFFQTRIKSKLIKTEEEK